MAEKKGNFYIFKLTIYLNNNNNEYLNNNNNDEK